MSVTIAKSEVGYFTSLAKKRAYDGARSVMRQCDHLAAEAASLDNHQTYDANKNAGFVLLDGGHSRHLSFMQGTCQYAGDQVQSLDLEAIEYRKDANNIDRQHKVQAQLSRTPEVTRYATPEGLVLVDNATGTLTYSTENGIQPSDR